MPLAVSLSCDINTGKNQLDCTNCLKCLRIDNNKHIKVLKDVDINPGHGLNIIQADDIGQNSFFFIFKCDGSMFISLQSLLNYVLDIMTTSHVFQK